MTWPNLFAVLIGALAVLPVLYASRMILRRMHREAVRAERSAGFASALDGDDGLEADGPPRYLGARFAMDRTDRPRAATLDARTRPLVFEYTIRPQKSGTPHTAPDLGGFTKVPLMLYDRMGNCVLVHRRISLN